MGVIKKRLTDILIEGNYITQEQLDSIIEKQKNTGEELRSILIKEGFIRFFVYGNDIFRNGRYSLKNRNRILMEIDW